MPRKKIHDLRATDMPAGVPTAEVEIVDPYGDAGIARVSVRDDHLALLWARKVIEPYEYEAGRRWQHAYELSQLGNLRGIDPTRERVDGGAPPEPLTARKLSALAALRSARDALGSFGDALLTEICGHGRSLAEVAAARGLRSRADREYLGRRFRECLQTLAEHWGLCTARK